MVDRSGGRGAEGWVGGPRRTAGGAVRLHIDSRIALSAFRAPPRVSAALRSDPGTDFWITFGPFGDPFGGQRRLKKGLERGSDYFFGMRHQRC